MAMTYKFRSKACGDVFMLQATGDQVLRAMGIAPASRGLIRPEGMRTALDTVSAAIERDEAPPPVPPAPRPAATDSAISLRQRAWPLVKMLKAAQADGEDVVWDW